MARRIAIIEQDKCHPDKCGNLLCARLCPVNRKGEDCISKNTLTKKAMIDEKQCSGCGICPKRCPFEAIHIINLPEKLEGEPIHRFGRNSFELFNLPTIKPGSVVGLIGRNGIGKSTAFEVLAGNITPNNGNYDTELTEENIKLLKESILQKYSNSQIGEYFTKVFDKKITISYKPQRIELLPKLFSGKVIDLLEKVDEKGKVNEMMDLLELTQVKDNNISDLSGGELQKVAIIATALKKADVYYFDEPSSFLDITSRVKMAKLIQSLKEDNSAVMVIEHDIATLDYISDEIQIVYGERACYGVTSISKGVRKGINDYLEGYLPEDNVRFRDYQIKFSRSIAELKEDAQTLVSYKNLKKSFENFKMNAEGGEIKRGEVLAIMGSNGLGKSTFVKMITNQLKADEGEIEGEAEMKISYKPQYPEPEDIVVEDYLKHHAGKEMQSGWYEQNILEKLNIKSILKSNLRNLSGGELQKVFVAGCLSGDSDLIVLDEPSAFIDIEDRINIAEVIKEFTRKKEIACVVVDHDVQFIEYLGDKMLVFEGIPGKEGSVYGPCPKEEGMNRVLKMLEITYRKDKDTNRARINKPNSQLDKEQRSTGNYYYI
ncbi:ribosome biogenesis/translation initiation ATPase RLI [Candidatus Woesearchaeota archaeon]|nr:ribosome biogenesis/translation initiation ATPase RLI [Candidatus Woesearchaeota archaeon]MBT5042682.1 ribosome biogenesis/translation initiation ATPase RLI [Candidatus Woesearchaeota archaeon]MBT6941445.1 ribosome biogenesis/translation initiation ATPase RLI [Candidatus Woesearchaeota archaeon]